MRSFKLDRDYVIKDGRSLIGPPTGRLCPDVDFLKGFISDRGQGTREVKQESLTFATITFQNYSDVQKLSE